jgi:copper chaperone CopZ
MKERAVQRLVLTVPDMWADHHILAARRSLADVPGIAAIEASALDFQLTVDFDPSATTADAIIGALAAAGYAAGTVPAAPLEQRDKPGWANAPRVTTTDPSDLAMSGDFRQY